MSPCMDARVIVAGNVDDVSRGCGNSPLAGHELDTSSRRQPMRCPMGVSVTFTQVWSYFQKFPV
jgi:hypothetical protein